MTEVNFEHLQWVIASRQKNQACSLRILKLLTDYKKQWNTKGLSYFSQELISISFSLWRAAFLANKIGKRSIVFAHGVKFLNKVIEDNSIAYAQDKDSNEWTFNYYTKNARHSFEYLYKIQEKIHPYLIPKYERVNRNPRERWEYCQDLLDQTVSSFENYMKEHYRKLQKSTNSEVKRAPSSSEKRKRVRSLTELKKGR